MWRNGNKVLKTNDAAMCTNFCAKQTHLLTAYLLLVKLNTKEQIILTVFCSDRQDDAKREIPENM